MNALILLFGIITASCDCTECSCNPCYCAVCECCCAVCECEECKCDDCKCDTCSVYELKNITVIDGDTIKADVSLPFNLKLADQVFRASDYDACEVSKRRRTVEVSSEEIERGLQAKRLLTRIVSDGSKHMYVKSDGKKDVYGRYLGQFYVKEDTELTNIKDILTKEHLLRDSK